MAYRTTAEAREEALREVAQEFGPEPRALEEWVQAAAKKLGIEPTDLDELKGIRGRIYAQDIKHARGELDYIARVDQKLRVGAQFYKKAG